MPARRMVVNWARCHYKQTLMRCGLASALILLPVQPFGPPPIPTRRRRFDRKRRRPVPIRMAITRTSLLTNADTANNNSSTPYTTGNLTSNGNELVIASTCMHHTTAGAMTIGMTHNASTNPLTFVLMASVDWNTIASQTESMAIFRAMKASGSNAGTVSITHSITCSNNTATFDSYAGVVTGGTDGDTAVGTAATNKTDSATSLTVTITAPGAGNACTGSFEIPLASSSTFTVGSGYTQIAQLEPGAEAQDFMAEWRTDGQATVDASVGATPRAIGGVAVEIKAPAAAAGQPKPVIVLQAEMRAATW
jgi:hypothetical protein